MYHIIQSIFFISNVITLIYLVGFFCHHKRDHIPLNLAKKPQVTTRKNKRDKMSVNMYLHVPLPTWFKKKNAIEFCSIWTRRGCDECNNHSNFKFGRRSTCLTFIYFFVCKRCNSAENSHSVWVIGNWSYVMIEAKNGAKIQLKLLHRPLMRSISWKEVIEWIRRE